MKIDNRVASTKLLWLDMEMTGLDPAVDRIVEIAAVVTDFKFKTIDTYRSVIYQTPDVLKNMNQWVLNTHNASGLVDKINDAPPEDQVIKEFVSFIKNNFTEPAVIAGNSIHQDRRFIQKWWPEVEELLHYRMVDVSSYKIIMQSKYNLFFNKKEAHRAADDIYESIAELKYYLSYFKK